MPKTNIDYSNTIIYKIVCKDINNKDCYVGHTTCFTKRKYRHKYCCNNPNDKGYNLYVYKFIRENGGWDNWEMVEVDKVSCVDSNEALKHERHYIEQLKATLNKVIPTRTDKEYYETNKEKFKELHKQYHIEHKEERLEQMKQYRDDHKEERKE